jgi:hypothetical protein
MSNPSAEQLPRTIADDWMERDLESRGMFELLRQFRRDGWRVAVHNDYMQDGQLRTFWLLTFGNWCVRGEGPTDYAALQICRHGIERLKATAEASR